MTLYLTHQNITFYFKHVVAFYAAAYKFPLKCYLMKESQHRIARWILWIAQWDNSGKFLWNQVWRRNLKHFSESCSAERKRVSERFISLLWVWWHPKSSSFFREDPKLLENFHPSTKLVEFSIGIHLDLIKNNVLLL